MGDGFGSEARITAILARWAATRASNFLMSRQLQVCLHRAHEVTSCNLVKVVIDSHETATRRSLFGLLACISGFVTLCPRPSKCYRAAILTSQRARLHTS